ncbi:MAG: hypothetical protein J6Q03_00235 [Paludibacteraceae bacterium]|nr:hypothetical protein [Paludibacteraceae bacterium]
MMIPVYGLSGIDGAQFPGSASLEAYAARMVQPSRRAAFIRAQAETLHGIEGIYNVAAQKIADGTAQPSDYTDARKAKVLIILSNTDFEAYRLASHIVPYIEDIDEQDGGYLFYTQEQVDAVKHAEDDYINMLHTPGTDDEELAGWLKKLGKALASGVKAVGTGVSAAAKSVVNATKATANTLKAAGQLVTGNTSGAKESIKKAGNQFKDSAIDPWKAAYEAQKDIVNLTKETVKIAGKVLKVLFIKINPVTVLLRNGLRSLIALNLAGMATKLNVGLLTQSEAAALGYSESAWKDGVKAMQRLRKLFKTMGGNVDKLEKSIKKGSKLPEPKVDKNTKFDMPTNDTDDGEPTLGDPATIAATIAACIGILTQIWQWIASIKSAKEAAKEAKAQEAQLQAQNKANAEAAQAQLDELRKIYAFDSAGNFYMDENGNYITWEQYWANENAAQEGDDTKKYLIAAAAAGGLLLLFAAFAKKR